MTFSWRQSNLHLGRQIILTPRGMRRPYQIFLEDGQRVSRGSSPETMTNYIVHRSVTLLLRDVTDRAITSRKRRVNVGAHLALELGLLVNEALPLLAKTINSKGMGFEDAIKFQRAPNDRRPSIQSQPSAMLSQIGNELSSPDWIQTSHIDGPSVVINGPWGPINMFFTIGGQGDRQLLGHATLDSLDVVRHLPYLLALLGQALELTAMRCGRQTGSLFIMANTAYATVEDLDLAMDAPSAGRWPHKPGACPKIWSAEIAELRRISSHVGLPSFDVIRNQNPEVWATPGGQYLMNRLAIIHAIILLHVGGRSAIEAANEAVGVSMDQTYRYMARGWLGYGMATPDDLEALNQGRAHRGPLIGKTSKRLVIHHPIPLNLGDEFEPLEGS